MTARAWTSISASSPTPASVVNHDDSETQASPGITPTTFVRSICFRDPDGILLEFAAWTRAMTPEDVNCEPQTAVEA